jgi:hypothetical protein
MNRIAYRGVLSAFVLFAAGVTASAQFKETPPAPYTQAVARQKIRALLSSPDSAAALSGLLVWYRDLVDEELIAAWKSDTRANLPPLMAPLADTRVASAIVEFSWRQQRPATFNLTYAPMLGDLMARYPESAGPFLNDLLGVPAPILSPSEAETVSRILLDMPDTGNWKKVALQVLPHYRLAAQNLLMQDSRSSNQEKSYRAQFWLSELRWNVPVAPAVTGNQPQMRTRPMTLPSPPPQTTAQAGRPHIVGGPAAPYVPEPYNPAPSQFAMPYSGPKSGTLKCGGGPVPPNGEYVFSGLPMGNLQVDLEGKPWDARLVPNAAQTQDLVLKNKSDSPQKRCTVHWTLIP